MDTKQSRDDPNAPFRWICPRCNTVNIITATVCEGCDEMRPAEAQKQVANG